MTGGEHGAGKTGGLPGDNADLATLSVGDEELRDTVKTGEVATPFEEPHD